MGVVASGLWVPAVLVAVWWVASSGSDSLYFPPLSQILSEFADSWLGPRFSSDLLPSLRNLFLGYSIAVVVGVLLGLLLGSSPRLLDAITPELEFARSVPAVALLPAATLVLGLGGSMRVSLIAFGSVWPVLLSTVAGVLAVGATVRDVESAFDLGPVTRFAIRLRAALPKILGGARTSLSIAIVLIVVSEMQGTSGGIGGYLWNAQRNFAISQMWSGMLMLGLLGYVLSTGFIAVERLLLRHYPPSTRGDNLVRRNAS
jgi:sulfonate transport system permease protein